MKQNTMFWIVVGVVALGGLFFLMSGNPASAPTGDVVDGGSTTGTSSAVPAPGAVGIDETIVGGEGGVDSGSAVIADLTGENFAFSKDEVRANVGDEVTVNFSSTEGSHNWTLSEFNAATRVVSAGGVTSVTFTAERAGAFEFFCSVGTHRALGMTGTLIVE